MHRPALLFSAGSLSSARSPGRKRNGLRRAMAAVRSWTPGRPGGLPRAVLCNPFGVKIWLLGAAWVAVCAGGCAGIRVRRAHAPDLFEAWRASAVTACELSPRTLQTLRRWDLDQVYPHNPGEAAARLHAVAVQDP